MSSFSKLGRWPVAYFHAVSAWLMEHRKEVAQNIITLNSEIERIGFVTVLYQSEQSENRIGFKVTQGSSLEKLIKAYVALGGNPFDISPFWMPDDSTYSPGQGFEHKYPYGGYVSIKSAAPNEPLQQFAADGSMISTGSEESPAGDPTTTAYFPARQGMRAPPTDMVIVSYMRNMRDWANQAIKERVQNIEWQIVKLMDLREQLSNERDKVLQQAMGGMIEGVPGYSSEVFDDRLTLHALVEDMENSLTEEGVVLLDFTFASTPNEHIHPLGC